MTFLWCVTRKEGNAFVTPVVEHWLVPPDRVSGIFGNYWNWHRQDSTYHGLCCTSRGALAGTRNSSMVPPHEGSIWWPIAPWANALTTELHLAPWNEKYLNGSTMKDRSDDPSHHERTLLPRSCISLHWCVTKPKQPILQEHVYFSNMGLDIWLTTTDMIRKETCSGQALGVNDFSLLDYDITF